MTSSTLRHSLGQSPIAILFWRTTSGCISVAFPALQQSIKRLFCRPWKSLKRNSPAGTHYRKIFRALNSQFDVSKARRTEVPQAHAPLKSRSGKLVFLAIHRPFTFDSFDPLTEQH